jgi:cytochrome b pre-mRNA-processing protein 3
MSVGRHVRRMAEGFLGRVRAYEAGLSGAEPLATVLRRNLYGTVDPAPHCVDTMADYIQNQAAHLALQPVAELLAGRVGFLAPAPDQAAARRIP